MRANVCWEVSTHYLNTHNCQMELLIPAYRWEWWSLKRLTASSKGQTAPKRQSWVLNSDWPGSRTWLLHHCAKEQTPLEVYLMRELSWVWSSVHLLLLGQKEREYAGWFNAISPFHSPAPARFVHIGHECVLYETLHLSFLVEFS